MATRPAQDDSTVRLDAADRRRTRQVEELLATAERVTEALRLETVLTAIVDDARSLLDADSGDVLLWDKARGRLRVVAVARGPKELHGVEVPFGEGRFAQAAPASGARRRGPCPSTPRRAGTHSVRTMRRSSAHSRDMPPSPSTTRAD